MPDNFCDRLNKNDYIILNYNFDNREVIEWKFHQ